MPLIVTHSPASSRGLFREEAAETGGGLRACVFKSSMSNTLTTRLVFMLLATAAFRRSYRPFQHRMAG
jgi:hypothetical protein